jgi:3-deoxy-D-manno-octulosonate 8-phosphate phosphatase (KDO 8-P phosphatase)
VEIETRCQPIELMLCDVDGVLTDGQIVLNNQGIESKRFHIRDGVGIKLWQKAGYQFGVLTGRSSHLVKMRVGELGIGIIRQGVDDKLAAAKEILAGLGLTLRQTCYLGDDLPDMPLVHSVGLGIAVADACPELRQAAHWITSLGGGLGAVREAIEMILRAQHRWDDLIQEYR